MDAHEKTPSILVLSVLDTRRRRRWKNAKKQRIVEESHLSGSAIADVARPHEISRSMFYDCRLRYGRGLMASDVRFSAPLAVTMFPKPGRSDIVACP